MITFVLYTLAGIGIIALIGVIWFVRECLKGMRRGL